MHEKPTTNENDEGTEKKKLHRKFCDIYLHTVRCTREMKMRANENIVCFKALFLT